VADGDGSPVMNIGGKGGERGGDLILHGGNVEAWGGRLWAVSHA